MVKPRTFKNGTMLAINVDEQSDVPRIYEKARFCSAPLAKVPAHVARSVTSLTSVISMATRSPSSGLNAKRSNSSKFWRREKAHVR